MTNDKPKLVPIDIDELSLTEKRIFNLTEDLKYLQNVSIIKINDSLDNIKQTQKDNNIKLNYLIKYLNNSRSIMIAMIIGSTLLLHFLK